MKAEVSAWHLGCLTKTMIATLFILGFVAVGLVIALITAAKAPVGYEDETGFHYGPEQITVPEEVGWENHQPAAA